MCTSISFAFYAPCGMSPLQHMHVASRSLVIRVAGHIVPEYFCYCGNYAYSTSVIHPYKRGHLPYRCLCPASQQSDGSRQVDAAVALKRGCQLKQKSYRCYQQHFNICHSKKCHKPCTCHRMQRDGTHHMPEAGSLDNVCMGHQEVHQLGQKHPDGSSIFTWTGGSWVPWTMDITSAANASTSNDGVQLPEYN